MLREKYYLFKNCYLQAFLFFITSGKFAIRDVYSGEYYYYWNLYLERVIIANNCISLLSSFMCKISTKT